MLFGVLGAPKSRRDALSMFGLGRTNRKYRGTDDDEILRALAAEDPSFARARWLTFAGAGRPLLRAMRAQLRRRPTLLSFEATARIKRKRRVCEHVVTLVGLDGDRAHFVDPLGRADVLAAPFANVAWAPDALEGTFYTLRAHRPISLLRW